MDPKGMEFPTKSLYVNLSNQKKHLNSWSVNLATTSPSKMKHAWNQALFFFQGPFVGLGGV